METYYHVTGEGCLPWIRKNGLLLFYGSRCTFVHDPKGKGIYLTESLESAYLYGRMLGRDYVLKVHTGEALLQTGTFEYFSSQPIPARNIQFVGRLEDIFTPEKRKAIDMQFIDQCVGSISLICNGLCGASCPQPTKSFRFIVRSVIYALNQIARLDSVSKEEIRNLLTEHGEAGWYVFTDTVGADPKLRLWEILDSPLYTNLRTERAMLKEGIRRAFDGLLYTDTGGIS